MNRRPGARNNRGRISAGGAPAPFTPAAYSPVGWWRSDLGVTLNGGDVSAWADQSGNGSHLLQANPALQPLYSASDANFGGQPSITLTAANGDCLECLTGGSSGNPQHSIFAVLRTGALAASFAAFVNYGRSTASTSSSLIGENSGDAAWYGGGGQTLPTGANLVTATTYRLGKTHNGTDTQGYRNGATDGATAARTYTLASPPGYLIGGRDGATGLSNFTIVEWVVYNSVLSGAQITTLDDYFRARYGL